MLEISGILTNGDGCPPASTSNTEKFPPSDSRDDITAPAEPAPTFIKKDYENNYETTIATYFILFLSNYFILQHQRVIPVFTNDKIIDV